MTKEEFEKNLKERLKNAINDYKKEFNLTGKKSPTSIGGAMNCPIVF